MSKFDALNRLLGGVRWMVNMGEMLGRPYLAQVVNAADDEFKAMEAERGPKKAKNAEAALEAQDKRGGMPKCWIQWKGTDVCMDFNCACGKSSHVDADFAYNIKCPYCGRFYSCSGHIEIIELEEAPENFKVGAYDDDD